jgi:hypothetical protein
MLGKRAREIAVEDRDPAVLGAAATTVFSDLPAARLRA